MSFKANNPGCLCCFDPPCNSAYSTFTNSTSVTAHNNGKGGYRNDGGPTFYNISVSGITNGSCTDCDNLNGDHTLQWVDPSPSTGPNYWKSTATSPCGSTNPAWEIVYEAGNDDLALRSGNGQWTYRRSDDFPRVDCHTVTEPSVSIGECQDGPSSIVLTPCRRCTECTCATVPESWTVTIANIAEYRCPECPNLNATLTCRFPGYRYPIPSVVHPDVNGSGPPLDYCTWTSDTPSLAAAGWDGPNGPLFPCCERLAFPTPCHNNPLFFGGLRSLWAVTVQTTTVSVDGDIGPLVRLWYRLATGPWKNLMAWYGASRGTHPDDRGNIDCSTPSPESLGTPDFIAEGPYYEFNNGTQNQLCTWETATCTLTANY